MVKNMPEDKKITTTDIILLGIITGLLLYGITRKPPY